MPKRSGFPVESYKWEDEYYQVSLVGLTDFSFTRKTFRATPALVARKLSNGYREEIEYTGQPYDESEYELVKARWDHQHCKVCNFTIDSGFSYWENDSKMIVCDVCHDHIRQTLVEKKGGSPGGASG